MKLIETLEGEPHSKVAVVEGYAVINKFFSGPDYEKSGLSLLGAKDTYVSLGSSAVDNGTYFRPLVGNGMALFSDPKRIPKRVMGTGQPVRVRVTVEMLDEIPDFNHVQRPEW